MKLGLVPVPSRVVVRQGEDLGRPGHLRYGIPPSGPIDRAAFIVANRLVGNADGAAGLECTVMGPRVETGVPCAIASRQVTPKPSRRDGHATTAARA